MKTVRDPSLVPPGGAFIYKQAESGVTFRAHSLDLLAKKVADHRKANNFPIGVNFDGEIEEQVCQNQPDICVDNNPRERPLYMADIIRGTRVILSFKLAGSPLVPREEAERRARICANCENNVDFRKPCSGICRELREVIQAVVGGPGTSVDGQLKACRICACANAAQVHVPMEFLRKGITPEMNNEFPAWCWKKEQS